MDALLSKNKEQLTIEMLRDDCKVIQRRGEDVAAAKRGFARLHRILAKMPAHTSNTLLELKKTRDSRGRL